MQKGRKSIAFREEFKFHNTFLEICCLTRFHAMSRQNVFCEKNALKTVYVLHNQASLSLLASNCTHHLNTNGVSSLNISKRCNHFRNWSVSPVFDPQLLLQKKEKKSVSNLASFTSLNLVMPLIKDIYFYLLSKSFLSCSH